MATQDDYIRTALRVPPDLHARIHEQAKANNRTFNAEIVARLEGSFTAGGESASDEVIQAAADRAAQATLDTMMQLLEFRRRDVSDVDMFGQISGIPSNGKELGPQHSRTPQIPGVNAPARQSKRK